MSLESFDAGGMSILYTPEERYGVNFTQPGEYIRAKVEMTHEMEPARQAHYLRLVAEHLEQTANELDPPRIREGFTSHQVTHRSTSTTNTKETTE